MEEDKGTVCVTGGNGYLASWLVMRLLQRGYSVRATVRSDKNDISFLTNLPGASRRLKIFNADLYKPESFDAPIQGCIGVFHVAHPMELSGIEIDEKPIEAAVNGLLGILKACLKSKSVKRVVYTSSTSSVAWNEEPEDAILDENTWSDIDFIRTLKCYGGTYFISKNAAEKAAFEFAENHGIDLVSVIPSLITGPFICHSLPISIRYALCLVFGNVNDYEFIVKTSMVHVDDLANAHIHLFEYPQAKGRYICSSHDVTIQEIAEFLSAKYPDMRIPSPDALKDAKAYMQKRVSSKKLVDTGFQFQNGLDEMFEGAVQCCKEKGFL